MLYSASLETSEKRPRSNIDERQAMVFNGSQTLAEQSMGSNMVLMVGKESLMPI